MLVVTDAQSSSLWPDFLDSVANGLAVVSSVPNCARICFFCHWGWQITWLRNQKVQRLLPDARDSEASLSLMFFGFVWYTQHARSWNCIIYIHTYSIREFVLNFWHIENLEVMTPVSRSASEFGRTFRWSLGSFNLTTHRHNHTTSANNPNVVNW